MSHTRLAQRGLLSVFAILLFLTGALLLTDCGGRKLIPVFEEEVPAEDDAPPPLSVVSLTVSMPYDHAARALDKALGEVVYEDNSFDSPDDDDLKLRVARTAPTVIRGYGEYVQVEPTVRVFAAYRYKACGVCPSLVGETDFEARVRVNARLSLLPEWRIRSESAPGGYEFIKQPYLGSGIIKFNISFLVRRALDDNLPKLCRLIDDFIFKRSGLYEELSKTWSRLFEPVMMDDTHKAWVQLEPKKILVSPLMCDARAIKLKTALETLIKVRFGAETPPFQKGPLPGAVIEKNFLPESRLSVPVSIAWERLDQILKENLSDTVFSIGKNKKVLIQEVRLRGNHKLMVARITLEGDLPGTLWLGGTPTLDTAARTLYLKNLDYTLRTKDALAGPLSVLLRLPVRQFLTRRLVWHYGALLDEVNQTVQQYLQGYTYGQVARIRGKAQPLKPAQLTTSPRGVHIFFQWQGQAGLELMNVHELF